MQFFPAFDARVRTGGAAPLVTCYYHWDGETVRSELSVISFDNWVAKTANLLVDAYDLGEDDQVALPLLKTHPGHWMSLAWAVACWRAGVTVDLTGASAPLTVTAADHAPLTATAADPAPPAAGAWLVAALHPLGLAGTDLPKPARDYAAEVRGEADQYLGLPPTGDPVAWRDANREITQSQLLAEIPPRSGRLALSVSGLGAWQVLREAFLPAVTGGGSVVLFADGTATPALLDAEGASEITP